MKKSSTAKAASNKNFERKLTVGLDLGDRSSWYCMLDEAGEVVGEKKLGTTPKAMKEVFAAMPRSRIALETNVRRLIIDEMPVNPKYFEKMSDLLEALIKERKEQALHYTAYLEKIAELAKKVQKPESASSYPPTINSGALRAFYDNLGQNEELSVRLSSAKGAVKQMFHSESCEGCR